MNFLLEKFKDVGKKFFLSDVDKNDYVMMAVLDEIKREQKLKENNQKPSETKLPNCRFCGASARMHSQ
jgi:hypothetical protein